MILSLSEQPRSDFSAPIKMAGRPNLLRAFNQISKKLEGFLDFICFEISGKKGKGESAPNILNMEHDFIIFATILIVIGSAGIYSGAKVIQ